MKVELKTSINKFSIISKNLKAVLLNLSNLKLCAYFNGFVYSKIL